CRMSDTMDRRASLMLSVQRALLDEVPCEMVSVTAGWVDDAILLRAYFDGAVSEEQWLSFSSVSAEVVADFPEASSVDIEVFNINESPQRVLHFWAFVRKPAEPGADERSS